jgi:hypothetical protein
MEFQGLPGQFADLPEWEFTVEEVSFGIYKVCARDGSGRSVERTGWDPAAVLADCHRDAAELTGNRSR